ncbi:hypothetical protein [Vibrio sp.]|uniref:hypothetical protein n=1 Tax=Vibrio sp. TaxID=678 RepID=UPI003D102713
MATFNWEAYCGTPAWTDVATNTIVFSGSATDLTEPITVGTWQDGTHLGSGDPGTDQCGANHVPNVKYVSGTQFDGGSGTEALNDTNLVQTECTLRIKFTDAASVAISNARFYAFDGAVETNPAVGVEAYAFEQGVGASAWTQINDESGGIGGDNSGERLGLGDQTANTEHYFYIAISARPETVGAKTEFDLGVALTYS